ncbi:gamma-glutamylcyclotransferase [Brevibacillus sp. SYP-B805]|uniref:gamma-glutamylcyclotransferase family protein n=1 Tax=Brevibacillus sp. SYP-B805 TaxID=1578199 RepID=UPI0013ED6631|nr:gamma-glutamylcyclotransferase family protein [Brevibacillus sp. SYP-B805]NGQ95350.1 gamma-glutamylcyclotransferase [Brevibacillus sp. SYP-B805]
MNQQLPVFVYGSLRHGFGNHRLYLAPYPHEAYPAKAKGLLYHLPVSGYPAVLQAGEADASWVYGEVVFIPADVYPRVLAGLDELETYYGPDDPRNEYEREMVAVTRLDTGEELQAFIYVKRGEQERLARQIGIPVPEGDWRGFMGSRK